MTNFEENVFIKRLLLDVEQGSSKYILITGWFCGNLGLVQAQVK